MSLRARTVVPAQAPLLNRPTREAGGQLELERERQRPTARIRIIVYLVAAILLLVASQYLVSVPILVTEKQPTLISNEPSQSKGSTKIEQSREQKLMISTDARGAAAEAQREQKTSRTKNTEHRVVSPNDAVPRTQQTNKKQGSRKQTKNEKVLAVMGTPAAPGTNQLLYVGSFGLGHRLSKLSAAYHLVTHGMMADVVSGTYNSHNETTAAAIPAMDIDVLNVNWRSCAGTDDIGIFSHLFGSHLIPIQRETAATDQVTVTDPLLQQQRRQRPHQGKTVLVRNDVLGYYAGKVYQSAESPIPTHYAVDVAHNDTTAVSPWFQKMDSDVTFFRYLCDNFRGRDAVRAFQEERGWHNHTVIGLHIRAGNGEQDHFTDAARTIDNTTVYVHQVVQLLERFVAEQSVTQAPPLIFLATDQADLIPTIQDLTLQFGVETITFPQTRLGKDEGVSYQTLKEGRPCLDGWMTSMSDMFLLAECDTLVAGMRSTFTQILPLSLVFAGDRSPVNKTATTTAAAATTQNSRAPWKFCEADDRSLTCFRDRQAWLFRQDTALRQGRIRTIRIANDTSNSSGGGDSDSEQHHLAVVHKVMVHLPDVEPEPALQKARAFLADDTVTGTASGGTRIFPYGDRINSKYRTAKNKGQGWTWADAQ
jgi:hypothetical protein